MPSPDGVVAYIPKHMLDSDQVLQDCEPVRHGSEWTPLSFQVSEKFPEPKKRGKAPHAQDIVKEMGLLSNASTTWNRPRCGVPDYPALKEVHQRGRHRHRRFVLYGGRLDKTDLTYRYRSTDLKYIPKSSVHVTDGVSEIPLRW